MLMFFRIGVFVAWPVVLSRHMCISGEIAPRLAFFRSRKYVEMHLRRRASQNISINTIRTTKNLYSLGLLDVGGSRIRHSSALATD
jgi:hypothetical protein